MSRSQLELTSIFRRHGAAWRAANAGHVNLVQRRVMTAIEICRTATLGGHIERCQNSTNKRGHMWLSTPVNMPTPARTYDEVESTKTMLDRTGGASA